MTVKRTSTPRISPDTWSADPEEIARELSEIVAGFGSFTPETFAELKFHLLGKKGFTKAARDDVCRISAHWGHCVKCNNLYEAKKCPLWYELFKMITWHTVERAPPCIRQAYATHSIKTVTNYLVRANLIDPPYYRSRYPSSCKMMQNWGYCTPNEYCRAMKKGNPLEYNEARDAVKMSRNLE
ncbi:MAG: hypothetical protein ACP6KW_03510 [Candidatus Thorarchaeota archaeon]